MKPKKPPLQNRQHDLFRSELANMVNPSYPLVCIISNTPTISVMRCGAGLAGESLLAVSERDEILSAQDTDPSLQHD